MDMRTAKIQRNTTETQINLQIELDGKGEYNVSTGAPFLDHMLELFARHGRFDLDLICKGDTEIDAHHTTEDIGIALGQAFADGLGNKAGIKRYGSFLLPMDEALIQVALDFSGRAHLSYGLELPSQRCGSFDTELTQEFFEGFVRSAGLTLHIRQLAGTNTHHIIEGAFKAFGRALAAAVEIDEKYKDEIPSTKGLL